MQDITESGTVSPADELVTVMKTASVGGTEFKLSPQNLAVIKPPAPIPFATWDADRRRIKLIRRFQRQKQAIANAQSLPKLPIGPAGGRTKLYDLACRMAALNPTGFRQMGKKRGVTKPKVRNWMTEAAMVGVA